jgi:F-type H+-transporting ATPase subunit alpha
MSPHSSAHLFRRYEVRSRRIAAALQQQPGHPVPLQDLVVTLFAIQEGLADGVPAKDVAAFLEDGLRSLRNEQLELLADIARSKQLTAKSERGIAQAFSALLKQRESQSDVSA